MVLSKQHARVWRERVFQRIEAIRLVIDVLANSLREAVSFEAWEAGARRSATALSTTTARLVLTRDTSRPGFDLPTCLARADHIGLDPSPACTFSLTVHLEPTISIFEAERRDAVDSRRAACVRAFAHSFCHGAFLRRSALEPTHATWGIARPCEWKHRDSQRGPSRPASI
jgi:hypothetical protein